MFESMDGLTQKTLNRKKGHWLCLLIKKSLFSGNERDYERKRERRGIKENCW